VYQIQSQTTKTTSNNRQHLQPKASYIRIDQENRISVLQILNVNMYNPLLQVQQGNARERQNAALISNVALAKRIVIRVRVILVGLKQSELNI